MYPPQDISWSHKMSIYSSHVDFDYSDKLFRFSTMPLLFSLPHNWQAICGYFCCCCSVLSNSLQSYGLQNARLPCPSLSHSTCSNSCPLSWWCHPTTSSPATPFSSCPQSFLASGSFPMSQLFASGDQSIGASALVLWMNIKGWFPLEFTGSISLLPKGPSRLFSSTRGWKQQFFSAQPSLWSNSHIHTWLLDKTIALIIWTFVGKVMSLLFNMLTRFVIAFLPRSKHLLISWLQSLFTVILEPKKIKYVTVSILSSSICHEVMGLDAMILFFEYWGLS